jgi:hypothetical protein
VSIGTGHVLTRARRRRLRRAPLGCIRFTRVVGAHQGRRCLRARPRRGDRGVHLSRALRLPRIRRVPLRRGCARLRDRRHGAVLRGGCVSAVRACAPRRRKSRWRVDGHADVAAGVAESQRVADGVRGVVIACPARTDGPTSTGVYVCGYPRAFTDTQPGQVCRSAYVEDFGFSI